MSPIHLGVEDFKNYLQQEFMRRSSKNSSYSLRSFANHLDINHATLSAMLSGKRKITQATVTKFSHALGLSPSETQKFERDSNDNRKSKPYVLLQADAFARISDWYYDAILELSLIKNIKLNPKVVSSAIGISELKAKLAIETLVRLELLVQDDKERYSLKHKNTSNILDPDFTSAAHKKYQKAILEKSVESIDECDRKLRDHTSTTMAIQAKDLPEAKKMIQSFRHKLNKFLQRDEAKVDEVYQLQVSFFPISKLKSKRSKK